MKPHCLRPLSSWMWMRITNLEIPRWQLKSSQEKYLMCIYCIDREREREIYNIYLYTYKPGMSVYFPLACYSLKRYNRHQLSTRHQWPLWDWLSLVQNVPPSTRAVWVLQLHLQREAWVPGKGKTGHSQTCDQLTAQLQWNLRSLLSTLGKRQASASSCCGVSHEDDSRIM